MPLVVLDRCLPPSLMARRTGRVRPVAPRSSESQREVISNLFLGRAKKRGRTCVSRQWYRLETQVLPLFLGAAGAGTTSETSSLSLLPSEVVDPVPGRGRLPFDSDVEPSRDKEQ